MPRENITSLQNPRIKFLVRLRDRKAREESGLTVIEGRREISLALAAGVAIKELFICPSLWQGQGEEDILKKVSASRGVVHGTTPAVFKKIAFGERQEGLLAVGQPPSATLDDLSDKKNAFYVVVDQVEKPGNLGAILRSCDAAGVDGVLISDGKTDIYNPNVVRSSLGTVFALKIVAATSSVIGGFLKKRGVKVVCADPQARSIYTEVDWKGNLAILVGSEQAGVSSFWRAQAGSRVRIPMLGRADSLNVSVATAILLYEAVRVRT